MVLTPGDVGGSDQEPSSCESLGQHEDLRLVTLAVQQSKTKYDPALDVVCMSVCATWQREP